MTVTGTNIMDYKCCGDINETICFNADCIGITYCTLTNATNGLGWPKVSADVFDGQKVNWQKFFEDRDKEIQNIINGTPRKECENCQQIRKTDSLPEHKIKQVLLSPWQVCNSNCIYCLGHVDVMEKNSQDYPAYYKKNVEPYDMLEIIKDMVANDVLDKNAKMNFAGGEPTLYPKFNDIVNYLVDNGFNNLVLHTNNIQYSKAVEKGIKQNAISLMISIDAGTKKCHEKVKRVKSFDKVWDNFKKYAKAKPKNYTMKLCTKYVIVPGINDSEKEISEFIKQSKKHGATNVALNVYNQLLNNMDYKPELIEKLYNLSEFFKTIATKNKLKYELFPNLDVVYLKMNKSIN